MHTDSSGVLTCEASWVKTASKANIFGAASGVRRCPELGWVRSEGSYRVNCFFRWSTFRKDMDSEESCTPTDGQIRTITFTCSEKQEKRKWIK